MCGTLCLTCNFRWGNINKYNVICSTNLYSVLLSTFCRAPSNVGLLLAIAVAISPQFCLKALQCGMQNRPLLWMNVPRYLHHAAGIGCPILIGEKKGNDESCMQLFWHTTLSVLFNVRKMRFKQETLHLLSNNALYSLQILDVGGRSTTGLDPYFTSSAFWLSFSKRFNAASTG